jgi:hypothetical protein
MLTAEKNRRTNAPKVLHRSIHEHIRWLEKRLAGFDDELAELIRDTPLCVSATNCCVPCQGSARCSEVLAANDWSALPGSPAFQYLPGLPGTHQQLGVIYGLVQAQSAMLAFNDIYWIIALAIITIDSALQLAAQFETQQYRCPPLTGNCPPNWYALPAFHIDVAAASARATL